MAKDLLFNHISYNRWVILKQGKIERYNLLKWKLYIIMKMHYSYNNKQILYRKKYRNSENEINTRNMKTWRVFLTANRNFMVVTISKLKVKYNKEINWELEQKIDRFWNKGRIVHLCGYLGFIIAGIGGVLIGLLEEFGDRQDQVNTNLNCIVSESVRTLNFNWGIRDHRNGFIWRQVLFWARDWESRMKVIFFLLLGKSWNVICISIKRNIFSRIISLSIHFEKELIFGKHSLYIFTWKFSHILCQKLTKINTINLPT